MRGESAGDAGQGPWEQVPHLAVPQVSLGGRGRVGGAVVAWEGNVYSLQYSGLYLSTVHGPEILCRDSGILCGGS